MPNTSYKMDLRRLILVLTICSALIPFANTARLQMTNEMK